MVAWAVVVAIVGVGRQVLGQKIARTMTNVHLKMAAQAGQVIQTAAMNLMKRLMTGPLVSYEVAAAKA